MDHTRHLNIYTVPLYFKVGIVGAGGIGAMTALVLAKMGVAQMTVWDDDVVSQTNIPTQLHAISDIGQEKINGLQRTLEAFSDEIIFHGVPERVTENTMLGSFNLLISAVDSITARQQIWQAVQNADIEWYVDGRMAAEKFDAFVLNMSDQGVCERYANGLMNLKDADVEELSCTQKATFHCASAAASNIGAMLRNILRGEQTSMRVIQYIPEFTFHIFNI